MACDHPPTHCCLSGDDASSAPSLHGVLSAAAAPSQHKNNKLQPHKPQLKHSSAHWTQSCCRHHLSTCRRHNGLIRAVLWNTLMFWQKIEMSPDCEIQTPESVAMLTESLSLWFSPSVTRHSHRYKNGFSNTFWPTCGYSLGLHGWYMILSTRHFNTTTTHVCTSGV